MNGWLCACIFPRLRLLTLWKMCYENLSQARMFGASGRMVPVSFLSLLVVVFPPAPIFAPLHLYFFSLSHGDSVHPLFPTPRSFCPTCVAQDSHIASRSLILSNQTSPRRSQAEHTFVLSHLSFVLYTLHFSHASLWQVFLYFHLTPAHLFVIAGHPRLNRLPPRLDYTLIPAPLGQCDLLQLASQSLI